ncbi:MAG: hypothetical protein MJ233_04905 [Mycoplasmoidaceae bacterium]|nr:hypothetical protein [Mycoplasmoidaceae bacterium]
MDLTADKFEMTPLGEIQGTDINTDNLRIKSFKVLNDSQVVINAYDESKIAYVVIKGEKNNNA